MRKTKITILLFLLLVMAVCQAADKADLVVIQKKDRIMLLMKNDKEFRRYNISLGGNPIGHKLQEGDQRTPEGNYVLDYKKSDSSFYKAIHASYPNVEDKKRAKQLGVNPGGFIMIHGQKNGFGWLSGLAQQFDWTDGCIAVKNYEMDEIWDAVDVGTPIQINP